MRYTFPQLHSIRLLVVSIVSIVVSKMIGFTGVKRIDQILIYFHSYSPSDTIARNFTEYIFFVTSRRFFCVARRVPIRRQFSFLPFGSRPKSGSTQLNFVRIIPEKQEKSSRTRAREREREREISCRLMILLCHSPQFPFFFLFYRRIYVEEITLPGEN